ncbi:hypothetical protein N0V82_005356 [Gnomoniopsis sp. IMI 355080]|nr:hypothetical protein N0V82_005356 [Gnomoniopsis sp. IMI 355080]
MATCQKHTASMELPGASELNVPSEPQKSTHETEESKFANVESDPSTEATIQIQEITAAEQTESTKPTDKATSSNSDVGEAAKSPITQLSSEEITLAQDISGFLKSIAPWKALMPSQLSGRMEKLQERTEALEQPKTDERKWDSTVKHMTMQDWAKNIDSEYDSEDEKAPNAPVMKAYYRDTTLLQRVQIDSWELCEELAKATLVTGLDDEPILFVPQVEIRLKELSVELEDAKSKLQEMETGGPPVITNNQPNNTIDAERKATEKKKAVEDAKQHEVDITERLAYLQCYHDFVQRGLSDRLELREKAANGTLKTVAFADLWLIFRPGDIVFEDQESFKQMSRVFHVTGGQYIRRRLDSREYDSVQRAMASRHRHRHDGDSSDEEEEAPETTLTVGSWTSFSIDTFVMAFDGTKIGPVRERQVIHHFEGEMSILDLDVVPIRFRSDQDSLLQEMKQRGERLVTQKGHKSYRGQAREIGSPPGSAGRTLQSDVFIDPSTYYRTHPSRKPNLGPRHLSRSAILMVEEDESVQHQGYVRVLHGSQVDARAAEDFLGENFQSLRTIPISEIDHYPDHLRLLTPTAMGYAFQTREWYALDVDSLQNIDHSDEARTSGWKDLIIPEEYREILVALVDNHTSDQEAEPGHDQNLAKPDNRPQAQIDLIRGKGEGLIMLLHGPPGSGKTSTAETIAAYTNRPLYAITCGDLGTTPNEVEMHLNDHMERAGKWGCVLLLDEADVFLEKRSWHDMQRNALVSEYYSGILFLTTNRIGVIDEAFKSRIHIVMQYPRIDLSSTLKMWDNIMNRLEQDNEKSDLKIVFDRQALLKYAETHFHQQDSEDKRWNGRQIRNAFQSALALGNYDRIRLRRGAPEADRDKKKFMKVKLSKVNFKKIAETARDFEDYILNLRGEDSSLALNDEVRDDKFDPKVEETRAPAATPTRRNMQFPLRDSRLVLTPESSEPGRRRLEKKSITVLRSNIVSSKQVRQHKRESDSDIKEDLSQEEFEGDDEEEG